MSQVPCSCSEPTVKHAYPEGEPKCSLVGANGLFSKICTCNILKMIVACALIPTSYAFHLSVRSKRCDVKSHDVFLIFGPVKERRGLCLGMSVSLWA